MAMIWLSGILLFSTSFSTEIYFIPSLTLITVNTKVATVYDPVLTFNATAGAGSFNGSFVTTALERVNGTITYQALAYAYNFVTNNQFSIMASPVSCFGGCDSYIFPGALWSLNPAPPDNSPPDAVVKIYSSPAIQMDFMKDLSDGDTFSEQDCTVYGENGSSIGIKFCLAKSEVYSGSIIAGE